MEENLVKMDTPISNDVLSVDRKAMMRLIIDMERGTRGMTAKNAELVRSYVDRLSHIVNGDSDVITKETTCVMAVGSNDPADTCECNS